MSSAKHGHAMTKRAEKVAFSRNSKTKKKGTILAPTPMILQRLLLKDGTRGTVVEFRGRAGSVTYTLVDDFGIRRDFTRDDVASYK